MAAVGAMQALKNGVPEKNFNASGRSFFCDNLSEIKAGVIEI